MHALILLLEIYLKELKVKHLVTKIVIATLFIERKYKQPECPIRVGLN